VVYDTAGKPTVIAEGFRDNDIVVAHDGGMNVTHPGWDGREPSKVWYVSPKSEKKVVDTGLKFFNGVTLSPDQTLSYGESHRDRDTNVDGGMRRMSALEMPAGCRTSCPAPGWLSLHRSTSPIRWMGIKPERTAASRRSGRCARRRSLIDYAPSPSASTLG